MCLCRDYKGSFAIVFIMVILKLSLRFNNNNILMTFLIDLCKDNKIKQNFRHVYFQHRYI